MMEEILRKIYDLLNDHFNDQNGPLIYDNFKQKQKTVEGNQIYKIHPHVTLILKDDTIRARCNKLLIQNTGNNTAYLLRDWTLTPGSSLMIGTEYDFGLINADITVNFDNAAFDPTKPVNKRIEILELNTSHPEMAWHGSSTKMQTPN
ncbi:MAG TPA: hypothetical protein PK006_12350 [Saprospiraceae bacterium]|nr:hypothetical protein [Saprospiraceae bacterium]